MLNVYLGYITLCRLHVQCTNQEHIHVYADVDQIDSGETGTCNNLNFDITATKKMMGHITIHR